MKSEKLTLIPSELDLLLTSLSLMIPKKGHGLSYELNYIYYKGVSLFKDWINRYDSAKAEFYEKDKDGNPLKYVSNKDGSDIKPLKKDYNLKDGEILVFKTVPERIQEAQDMISKFESEELSLEIKPIPKDKLEKAIRSDVFEGIDLSLVFKYFIQD